MGLNDYTVVIWSHFGAVAASIDKVFLVIRSPVFKRFYCNHLVAFLGSGYLPGVKAF